MAMVRSRWTSLILTPSLLHLGWLASLLVIVMAARPVWAQTDDMFPTKAAALRRAKELNCTGAFAIPRCGLPGDRQAA